MSRSTTYLPSWRERPSCMTRPPCTATAAAFGVLIRSTNCRGWAAGAPAWVAAAAAALGEGDAEGPGVTDSERPSAALRRGAFARPVALDGDATGTSAPHATCLPVTGSPASARPVSVPITGFG